MSEDVTGGALAIPSGDGQRVIHLSMRAINQASRRQADVATVTKMKAPELLTALNRGWLDVRKLALLVNAELLKAQKALAVRKAVVIMEVMPDILKEKGIKQTNDTIREAVLTMDAEYQQINDRVQQLEAQLELLSIQAKAFDNSFTAVKRILGTPELLAETGNLNHQPERPTYQPNGLVCAVCMLPQLEDSGETTCAQRHRGAPGLKAGG